jgi:pimeloyl-ACP methyl ester carboxylesterase
MGPTVAASVTTPDGAALWYEVRGKGEPLLLLHGLGGTGGDWAHVFDRELLAERYRLIVPDARGHGRSTNPSGAFTFAGCARDVLAIVDALGVERAAAIGTSLGAKTLLHVATLAPERVRALVLVSATPRFPDATRAIFRVAAAAPHTPTEWTAMRAIHAQGDPQIAAIWALSARFAEDPDDMSFSAERLAAITAPTLVVAGDRDPLYPVELAVELYRGIPRASLYVVPGGGHGPIYEGERAPFAARALAFLDAAHRA